MTQRKRPLILVVDDDDIMHLYFKRMLESAGFDCRVAASAEDGLRAIKNELPDAVLEDLHMPGMNGLGLLRVMRSSEDWRAIPVAILTRDLAVPPEVVLEIANLGAPFLSGVITREELLTLAEQLTSATRGNAQF